MMKRNYYIPKFQKQKKMITENEKRFFYPRDSLEIEKNNMIRVFMFYDKQSKKEIIHITMNRNCRDERAKKQTYSKINLLRFNFTAISKFPCINNFTHTN